jgi:hypothetical protein
VRARVAWLVGAATIVVCAALASAQGGGKPVTGNPTPGTTQPAPPNLADRVTFAGCLQPVRNSATSAAPDANVPSDARFELTNAERVDRVPPGTGGSAIAVSASGKGYRLEGIDSQFSPFVGTKVEISGEIKAPANATPPTLLVEFVQKLAAKCS